MNSETPGMRTSTHDHDEQAARRKSRRIAAVVALAGAILAALAVWSRSGGEETRALEQLSAAERRALYERTLHTLQSTCAPQTRPAGLTGYCREQAEFIERFPECDQTCRKLAQRNREKPSR